MADTKDIEQHKDFLLYTGADGDVKLRVFLKDETLWLTQKMIADLFGINVPAVSKHLKNIFDTRELNERSVVSILETTANDGKKYLTNFYNLDAIIAVGYRVNSKKATHFRKWATVTLREYIIKGFTLDDERLKQGTGLFGKDYFQELLERVRSIRASERRIYLKITDMFAECSTDYDSKSEDSRIFYSMVQNKFHFAIVGKTAAEIIYDKADKSKPNMGLSTWKDAPKGRILASDVKVAKNYLSQDEIKKLERTVSSFFDYIENLILKRKTFTMTEFAKSVDYFIGKLEKFKKICHEYSDRTVYGAMAYLRCNEESNIYAERQGLFVIKAVGDSTSITNEADFKPKSF